VDNAFGFTWNPFPPKKKGQFYIQTWHGSMGLKRIGKENVNNKRWSFAARTNSRWVDLCVSNSGFETDVYRQTHWPKNEILELGHARNDIFFADADETARVIARVRQHFGIAEDKKIALYAPTFRNDDTTACYDLDHSRFLDALEERFGREFVLLNRYHMKTLKARESQAADGRILNATAYPDIQELMVAADVGITDYSSWICDFVLTGRPGFIYGSDLADYDRERGFYYPLEETPFPIAQTNDELVENVLHFDAELYAQKKERFLQARDCKETGTAAKQIVEIIKQQCGLNK
jgi:CDP-glycerol glycerophosphotransferase